MPNPRVFTGDPENAPISIYEEYAYTAALKKLINSEDNSLKVYVKNPKSKDGLIIDRILVYWSSAQKKDDIKAIEKPQNMFAHLNKYDPDDVINVKNFFADIKKGGGRWKIWKREILFSGVSTYFKRPYRNIILE